MAVEMILTPGAVISGLRALSPRRGPPELKSANPVKLGLAMDADFSSGGPRLGDSALKPDITAPGVSIISTAIGTGNQGAALSGTSMASPHVAGVAALTRQ